MALDEYRFTLNGTEIVRTPEEWENIELAIERNEDLNITVVRFTSKLTFVEDGYGFIFNEYQTDYNNTIDVLVERLRVGTEDYEVQFNGKILLSQVIFNLDKKTVQVAIEDDAFFSIINNRKNVQAILDSEFTINGVKISPMSFSDMDFFRANGIYTGALADRNVYEVKEALDFLVRFMTDNEVKGVVSDYLSDTTNFNDGLLYILTGEELRLKDQDAPDVSFEDLFRNLRRTHNLSFAFEKINGDTVMRIEEQEFFFNQTESLTIRNIKDLELSTDKDRIFSHLELGNETNTTGNFPTDVRFFVFVEEQYAIQGRSIVDRVLDLKNDFITDTNVFMDIVENNNDGFDDDILIVQGEAGGVLALQFSTPVVHYNTGFKNSEIVNRFLNGIPNSIAKFLTVDSTKCLIGATGQNIISTPSGSFVSAQLLYTNETPPFFDSGNNFVSTPDIDGNLSYYLIPFPDLFSFRSNNNFSINFVRKTAPFVDIDDANDANLTIIFNINRFSNDLTTLLETVTITKSFILNTDNKLEVLGAGVLNTPIVNIDETISFNSLLGNKIAVSIQTFIINANALDTFTMDFLDTSEFSCLGSQEDGGVFTVINPEDYRAQIYKFKKNVSLSEIGIVRDFPFQKIRINEGSNPLEDRSTWIKRLSLNLETSEATFELIT